MQDDQEKEPLTGKVVEMQRARSPDKEKNIAAFRAYWASMRKDGDIPRRSDIDPRGIESLLENAFIAENIAPGVTRLRIAGTHLSDLMGMEVRGMPLSSFIEPSQRKELALQFVELFDRPATLNLKLRSEGGIGRPALEGRLLMLPLRSDLGDISRALGCFVTQGPVGRTPRRFTILDSRLEPLEIIKPGLAENPVSGLGMAEAGKLFDHEASNPSERPYLRVVK